MSFSRTFIVLPLFLLLTLSFSSSHLENGKDITKDGYIIDLGFSPKIIQKDKSANFAINLVNSTTEQSIDIDSTWVRISLSDNVVFAGEFVPKKGSVAFTYTFPKSGNYTIDIKFYNGEYLVEEQDFSVSVEKNRNYGYIAIGIIFITILFFVIRRLKK